MKHTHTSNITCPYCNWEDRDSWEFDEDEGTRTCGSCDKEFNVSRDVAVTYNTSKIECPDEEHVYEAHDHFITDVVELIRKHWWTGEKDLYKHLAYKFDQADSLLKPKAESDEKQTSVNDTKYAVIQKEYKSGGGARMITRESAAVAAMQGLLASGRFTSSQAHIVAAQAVEYADALIAHLDDQKLRSTFPANIDGSPEFNQANELDRL